MKMTPEQARARFTEAEIKQGWCSRRGPWGMRRVEIWPQDLDGTARDYHGWD